MVMLMDVTIDGNTEKCYIHGNALMVMLMGVTIDGNADGCYH